MSEELTMQLEIIWSDNLHNRSVKCRRQHLTFTSSSRRTRRQLQARDSISAEPRFEVDLFLLPHPPWSSPLPWDGSTARASRPSIARCVPGGARTRARARSRARSLTPRHRSPPARSRRRRRARPRAIGRGRGAAPRKVARIHLSWWKKAAVRGRSLR
eukprot:COSAG02_NODE_4062_length_5843_cov_2.288997_1_plen_158_part_00